MPRCFDFDNLQNVVCEACIPPIRSELLLYKDTLHILLPDEKSSNKNDQKNVTVFNALQKSMTVAIGDDCMLSDEEIQSELRYILDYWLPKKDEEIKNPRHLLQADIGIFSGAAMMTIMLLNLEIDMIFHDLMLYSGIGIVMIIAFPTLKKAWLALKGKQNKINMDTLFAASTIFAVVASILHLFYPIIPSLIDAALMINGFRHLGLWIQESFTKPIVTREKFIDRGRNSKFQIRKNGVFVDYEGKLQDVPMGAVLRVPKGECIPLNGLVQDEAAEVTFTMHTGKEDVNTIDIGKKLCAGMVVASECVIFKVNALEADSYLRERDLSLINAQSKQAPIQDETSKILTWFMPAVLISAFIVGGLAGYFVNVGVGVQAFLYLMVCACPCALGMVTPLAINVGLDKLSNDSVRFKTAKGMQAIAQADTVVFDLNGTLTKNQPQVTRCTVNWRHFPLIFAMQAKSSHSIAKAIKDFIYPGKSFPLSLEMLGLEISQQRHGLIAMYQGDEYRIGNKDFIKPSADDLVSDFGSAQHATYFSKNGKVIGHFLLDDPLRDKHNAAQLISNLVANGISVKVFTGASQDTAEMYAKPLGLPVSAFVTNCVPTINEGVNNKCSLVQALQNEGHTVAMFGDAGNDVEAIKAADFGAVVYSRSTDPMAEQASDASIYSDTLLPQVIKLVAIGRQTMRHIKQNLIVSFLYNSLSLVFVSCAIFFQPSLLNPAFGAGIMVFQSLMIVMNAIRIKHQQAELPVQCKTLPQDQLPALLSVASNISNVVNKPIYCPVYMKSSAPESISATTASSQKNHA